MATCHLYLGALGSVREIWKPLGATNVKVSKLKIDVTSIFDPTGLLRFLPKGVIRTFFRSLRTSWDFTNAKARWSSWATITALPSVEDPTTSSTTASSWRIAHWTTTNCLKFGWIGWLKNGAVSYTFAEKKIYFLKIVRDLRPLIWTKWEHNNKAFLCTFSRQAHGELVDATIIKLHLSQVAKKLV